MKHSMKTAFWLMFTPRQNPGGTCVLRIAWSIRRFGTLYPKACSPESASPWKLSGSRPPCFSTIAGRTAARIDCPDSLTCSAVRLLLASNPPVSLHCITGWYLPWTMSSSRDHSSLIGVPGICLAMSTAWVT